jgi:hypothetical protein
MKTLNKGKKFKQELESLRAHLTKREVSKINRAEFSMKDCLRMNWN